MPYRSVGMPPVKNLHLFVNFACRIVFRRCMRRKTTGSRLAQMLQKLQKGLQTFGEPGIFCVPHQENYPHERVQT